MKLFTFKRNSARETDCLSELWPINVAPVAKGACAKMLKSAEGFLDNSRRPLKLLLPPPTNPPPLLLSCFHHQPAPFVPRLFILLWMSSKCFPNHGHQIPDGYALLHLQNAGWYMRHMCHGLISQTSIQNWAHEEHLKDLLPARKPIGPKLATTPCKYLVFANVTPGNVYCSRSHNNPGGRPLMGSRCCGSELRHLLDIQS